MPLSTKMNQIDTEHKSLSEIDPKIARFYSEDVRTRVTGRSEPDEDGNVELITEEYTVIVLNKPNEVGYDYAESRRDRRLGKDAIDQAITDAIAWEDFAINHDGYIAWRDRPLPVRARDESGAFVSDDVDTEVNEAWVDGFSQGDYDAQERPVIDMNTRRAVYTKMNEVHERDAWLAPSGSSELVDDDNYIITTISMGASDEDWNDFLTNPSPQYVKHLKLTGVEFEGVMCSATKEDMWGLTSVETAVRAGHPINFNFDSGETLVLTVDNIDAFQAVWLPFRMGFFQ